MTSDAILKLHKVMLMELRIPYFAPSMADAQSWDAFLFVMKSLEETPGGPLTPVDVRAVIRWMRSQNEKGAKWALRLSKIMRDPENFRDLVLERRRKLRLAEPHYVETVQKIAGVARSIEVPTSRDPVPMDEETKKFLADFERRKAQRKRGGKGP